MWYVRARWCVHVHACVYVCGCTGAGVCFCACSLVNPACNAPLYCRLQRLWFHHIFRHYVTNRTIFGESLLRIKCVFLFHLQLLFEALLVLRRIQPHVINVKTSPCKEHVILVSYSNNNSARYCHKCENVLT